MKDLVKKAQKGSDQAFLTLFQRYEEDIYRIAFIYVKNQNDALDVVQETAYRSFKTIKKLKQPNYFKTWLIRIAINCSLDLLKKQRKLIHLPKEYEDQLTEELNDDIELDLSLQDLMEYLHPDEKSIIILRFYEDLTMKEIAETLEMPLGTVKTILYRALAKLRKKMKRGDDDEK
ncbi:sigma-70 family RNA polymerase sigma factor [Ornithinibacillus halotolerans]|uniref:DNA-directed RNA polymerase sigma-70 factor n=1 Tax=Ornithinibacillus halotolerans TaxID=1274357 RepID=A0A916RUE6_9BACI|nr:sigma-70 family RNA polymerase sigma factor [Ornithinibacillus halotolerans]GGA67782.1 DNA-directed RNA polymerase sigma-70 factor [Ornithinibacillus halotolerans]